MSILNKHARKYAWNFARKFQQQTHPAKIQQQQEPYVPLGPVFRNAPNFHDRIALRDRIGTYSYGGLFISANELSKDITRLVQGRTNERILFMCPNDASYVITLWAIWMSGQIAVPLSPLHPKNILLYYANDSNSKLIITTSEYSDLMQRVSRNSHTLLHVLDDKTKLKCSQQIVKDQSELEEVLLPSEFYETSNGMILYTSGTTGSPKGVVLSHKNLNFQVNTLLKAWKWTPNDVLLHTLPLHHVHGIVNALLCPLSVGAKTIMLKKFNANTVWSYLLGVSATPDDRKITIYMAVPTIYSKLIDEYKRVFKDDPKMVEYIRNTLKTKMRLTVSGSAPLPPSIYDKWLEISGHSLLERYGMTEIGMALSNRYDEPREPGYVGVPLPGVSVRLVEPDEDSGELETILECTNNDGIITFNKKVFRSDDLKGELLVKSDGVFKEYLNRPEATRKEFTSDGWFKTGDICEYSNEKKKFRILGRKNVDIIKTGGYKVSALDVEMMLQAHPDIKEVSVVGVEDDKWGQRVAAVIVLHEDKEITLKELKEWGNDNLPKYAVPSMLAVVESIPKNSMGKVNKTDLIKMMF